MLLVPTFWSLTIYTTICCFSSVFCLGRLLLFGCMHACKAFEMWTLWTVNWLAHWHLHANCLDYLRVCIRKPFRLHCMPVCTRAHTGCEALRKLMVMLRGWPRLPSNLQAARRPGARPPGRRLGLPELGARCSCRELAWTVWGSCRRAALRRYSRRSRARACVLEQAGCTQIV